MTTEAQAMLIKQERLAALSQRISEAAAWQQKVNGQLKTWKSFGIVPDLEAVEELLEECRGLVVDCPEARELQELAWTQRASQELQSGTLGLSEARALMQEAEAIPVSKGSAEFVELHRRLEQADAWLKTFAEILQGTSTLEELQKFYRHGAAIEICLAEVSRLHEHISSATQWKPRAAHFLRDDESVMTIKAVRALLKESEGIAVQMEERKQLESILKAHQASVHACPPRHIRVLPPRWVLFQVCLQERRSGFKAGTIVESLETDRVWWPAEVATVSFCIMGASMTLHLVDFAGCKHRRSSLERPGTVDRTKHLPA